jgi:O-acetyl-ADP-ribose deacetylase (regulator of RNase III)
MIRTDPGRDPAATGAQAVILSMGTDLEPLTQLESALVLRAGPASRNRLQALEDLPIGGAVVLPGTELSLELIIHIVIRSLEVGVSEASLERAFLHGLQRAADWGVETLAVPPLGVGAGNLEAEASARAMLGALRRHRLESLLPRTLVILGVDAYQEEVFQRAARAFDPHVTSPETSGGS